MQNSTPILTLSVLASGALTANRFVGPNGAQAGAGANAIGLARASDVSGARVPVDVMGTSTAETGGAIAAGSLVEVDASGRAVTRNTGVAVARLAPGESAAGAGQFVEVLLLPN